MTGPATHGALQRIGRPLQGRSQAAWCALAIGIVGLLLGTTAWLVRLGWLTVPYWVLIAWGLALLAAVAVCYMGWDNQRRYSTARLARGLEEIGAWRAGALTALLDSTATGTSQALLDLADRAQAQEIDRRGQTAVEPIARSLRILVPLSMICLLAGVLAFTSAGPVRGVASALWHPRDAWEATVAPVRIRAVEGMVDRGQSGNLLLEAQGRQVATLWLRSPGEAWKPRGVRLDSLGRALVSTPPLTSDLFARLTSGSRSSDTVTIRVRLPVFLGALSVTAKYPSYLGLENEPVPTGGDTLLLPLGTRLETRGQVTAPLASAAWANGATVESLRVTSTGFEGTFTPNRSGQYRLDLVTRTGSAVAGDSVYLPIRLVLDSTPVVEIPLPGVDTLAPLSLKLPLVIDAHDDHSITRVTLESRRISRLGLPDSARRESLPVPTEHPDRAMLTYTLDLNHRGLLPGDTVRYFATAIDNAPRGHVGRSRVFTLRLPTLSEVRAAQRLLTEGVSSQLDSILTASQRLERQTGDLAQERPRTQTGQGEKRTESLTFEQAQRAEGIAKSQEEVVRQAESLKQSLEALKRSAEAAGLRDSAWQRQLAEIRDQLERAISPELREKLAALQEALRQLDPERAKAALEQLADTQKQLREALERSRDLFRRAALEGDLANLAQESKDLAREQRQWNQRTGGGDSLRSAVSEQQLSARADSLSAALRRVAAHASKEGKDQSLDASGKQAAKAANQMQQASGSMRQGQRGTAKQQGEQASRMLEPIGDQLDQRRQQMQQEWRREVTEAMDQALVETSRLAERQLQVQNELREGEPSAGTRAEQAAIEEGVRKILEQVKQAGGKNALVSPQIAAALGAAQLQMQQAREAISSAAPNGREAADQAGGAVDDLNAAAHQLMRARDDVSGAQSGSGLTEALEQLAKLAQQQGGVGRQTAGLLPMAGAGSVQQQLQRLAERQRALAQELEKLRGQGSIAGAGQMADEAKELSRRMEAGRLDRQVVERQQRLFRRMLDAGRTLQGHEEDQQKERQSTTATDDSVHVPPALQARLQDENERLRVPTWEELQHLSPEERRLVVDYFRRLSQMLPR
jgi:hypothetical protein